MKITTDWWGVAIHAEDEVELKHLSNLHQMVGPKATQYYDDGDVELVLPNTDEWVRLTDGVSDMTLDSSIGCLLITR